MNSRKFEVSPVQLDSDPEEAIIRRLGIIPDDLTTGDIDLIKSVELPR